jgi:hypothetical protein
MNRTVTSNFAKPSYGLAWERGLIFIYLLKLRGRRGRDARPIIAVHIKYYKYVLQKLTVGAIEI